MKDSYQNIDDKYVLEAKRVLEILMNDFVLSDGSLAISKTSGQLRKNAVWPDLGDFVIFFLKLGQIEFVEKQLALFSNSLEDNIMVSDFPSWKIRGLAKSYEYSDLLLGLIDYCEHTKSDHAKKILKLHADKAIEIFKFDGHFSSYYWPKFKFNFPIQDTRDGMMIEIFLDISKILDDKKFIEVSRNIYNHLISNAYFEKNDLLPTYVSSGLVGFLAGKKLAQAEITKNNINSLYGMLSLYQHYKDESILKNIDKIINKVFSSCLFENGAVIKTYGGQDQSRGFLTSSFAILDFLCDLYQETNKESYLEKAKQIAGYWLAHQGSTGLFPLFTNEKQSFFDSETDMCVALHKLAELSNDLAYSEAADKCLFGVLKYHRENDYISGVDIDTGKPLNKTIKSKFLALFTKILLLKYELSLGSKIYKDKELFGFLRDR